MNFKKIMFSTLCLTLFMSFFILMISAVPTITLTTSSDSGQITPIVVIDPGHGGEDGGAINDDGVIEKDINLEISLKAADLLNFFGFDVKMTRNDDIALSGDEQTVRARKVADMNKRLEIYNSDENNVVISIHQNKFEQTKYHGTQVFYSPNNENSKALAENVRFAVKKLTQPDNERECKKSDNGIYLLKHAKNPAIIVECGFISNDEECANLLDETYQKQISFAIISGFLDYNISK
ncbi:MAG: N-acetylmuramoyl-L-alanine amidase [Ruminococcus sp.]|nr:N-acetylmuramoyl-L-alanine amidase [Ruminococcus sp.]